MNHNRLNKYLNTLSQKVKTVEFCVLILIDVIKIQRKYCVCLKINIYNYRLK